MTQFGFWTSETKDDRRNKRYHRSTTLWIELSPEEVNLLRGREAGVNQDLVEAGKEVLARRCQNPARRWTLKATYSQRDSLRFALVAQSDRPKEIATEALFENVCRDILAAFTKAFDAFLVKAQAAREWEATEAAVAHNAATVCAEAQAKAIKDLNYAARLQALIEELEAATRARALEHVARWARDGVRCEGEIVPQVLVEAVQDRIPEALEALYVPGRKGRGPF